MWVQDAPYGMKKLRWPKRYFCSIESQQQFMKNLIYSVGRQGLDWFKLSNLMLRFSVLDDEMHDAFGFWPEELTSKNNINLPLLTSKIIKASLMSGAIEKMWRGGKSTAKICCVMKGSVSMSTVLYVIKRINLTGTSTLKMRTTSPLKIHKPWITKAMSPMPKLSHVPKVSDTKDSPH